MCERDASPRLFFYLFFSLLFIKCIFPPLFSHLLNISSSSCPSSRHLSLSLPLFLFFLPNFSFPLCHSFILSCSFSINRYKKLRQYDDMVRLVKRFHPDLVDQTHAHLAKVFDGERVKEDWRGREGRREMPKVEEDWRGREGRREIPSL